MNLGKELTKAVNSIDLNHNGKPDVQELVTPAGVLLLAHLLARGIIHFSPAHDTVAKTIAEKYEAGYSGPGGK